MNKKFIAMTLALACGLCGCKEDTSKEYNCNFTASTYENINEITNLDSYLSDAIYDTPVENGIIVSPYYSLSINGKDVPVYATRTANTIHSFTYLDVEVLDDSKDFKLDLQLKTKEASSALSKRNNKVDVLPLKKNVIATIEDKTISATLNDFGSYSFAFNNKQDEAFTIFVAKKENTDELFANKEIEYIEPGDYSTSSATQFSEENKVYYFKSGRYKINQVVAPSNSIVYLQQGAYLEVIPTTKTYSFYSKETSNVKITGRGLVDYSACCGTEKAPEGVSIQNDKNGLTFTSVNNIEFSGITVINSQTWTLCFNDCKEVKIHDVMLFGYRTFSDGIMLSDCKNALVERNFIRTGDDAFETKSTTANGLTENVWFKNNDAWTDKAIAYGCIYESNHDTTDVHFEDCRVGFALGSWSNHLGCLVIQMGNNKNATMHNITFNNIEIYQTYNHAALNIYIGGSGGQGAGYGTVKNIYFSNVTVRRNYGAFLNLRTYDSQNCSIREVYLDNIVSNDILLTADNYKTEGYIHDNVAGGYDYRYLKINTLNK